MEVVQVPTAVTDEMHVPGADSAGGEAKPETQNETQDATMEGMVALADAVEDDVSVEEIRARIFFQNRNARRPSSRRSSNFLDNWTARFR